MNEALIGLIGTFIGVVITGGLTLIIESHRCISKRISLARAFRADMDTLIRISEFRGYVTGLREAAEKQYLLCVSVKQNYLEIFEKNCSEIGLLPEHMVDDVVRFYTYTKSCLEDLDKHCSENAGEHAHKAYAELADIMDVLKEISHSFSKKVEEFSNKEASKFLYKFAERFF